MTVFSLIQRLVRDLVQTDTSKLTAEERQTITDCVNASLQRFHDLAPDHSKVTSISLLLGAPRVVTIGVTKNSVQFTGYVATDTDMYCTIRVNGDSIDNQIVGNDTLLMPYAGETGTVQATIYGDAVALPQEYSSIASNPIYADTRQEMSQGNFSSKNRLLYQMAVGEPMRWMIEPNGQHGDFRAVFRTDTLPHRDIRLVATARMAPPRIAFIDTMTTDTLVPIRSEHIEAYLIPAIRGMLAETTLWKSADTRSIAATRGEEAMMRYELMIPKQLTTPSNLVGTPFGF